MRDTVKLAPIIVWKNHGQIILYLILMGLIVLSGMATAPLFPPTYLAFLAGMSIVALLGLLLARFVKALSFLQVPLLISVSYLSGLMLYLLLLNGTGWQILAIPLLALLANYLVLTACIRLLKFQFQRFNLVLALLAIIFAFVGGFLIYISGRGGLQFIWLFATLLCLDILLYTLMQQILKTEDQPIYPMLSGVVLLHIALFFNLISIFTLFST